MELLLEGARMSPKDQMVGRETTSVCQYNIELLRTFTVPSSEAVKTLPPAQPAVRPTARAVMARVWSLKDPYGLPYGEVVSSKSRETRKTWTAASSDPDISSVESDVNDKDVTAR